MDLSFVREELSAGVRRHQLTCARLKSQRRPRRFRVPRRRKTSQLDESSFFFFFRQPPLPTPLVFFLLGRWPDLSSSGLLTWLLDQLLLTPFGKCFWLFELPPLPPTDLLAPWIGKKGNESQHHRKDRIFTGFRISCYGSRSHPGLSSMLRIAP